MKKLTAVAFLAVMMIGASANANVMLRREGVQNFYYYFGGPCPCPMAQTTGCEPSCETPCCPEPNPCCESGGIFDGMFFGLL